MGREGAISCLLKDGIVLLHFDKADMLYLIE